MKLALLSDLHANRQALDACLADARARGATQYAVLGDLVGYGADPAVVLDRVMDMAGQGAWVVRGNHDAAVDAAVIGLPSPSGRADQTGAAWTRSQLNPAQRDFLAALPLVLREDFILLVHASARDPKLWEYVEDADSAGLAMDSAKEAGATHVFGGHVHEQRLFFQGSGRGVLSLEPTAGIPIPVPRHRRWLATVGSVGQPRDGRPDAMYALFDGAAMRLVFLRVPYDVEAAAQAIRKAGLPEFYAQRLALGH
jgi:diadenosine tetraphosphatase ApaH/serine/threonine PP2A family protein phosphatase/microcompartment protein CcmK/EutM